MMGWPTGSRDRVTFRKIDGDKLHGPKKVLVKDPKDKSVLGLCIFLYIAARLPLPMLNLDMQQSSSCQISGHVINLNLRIELVHDITDKQSGGSKPEEFASVREVNIDKDCPTTESREESMADVKERLRRAELGCARLEELYKKYRLRWLEENYRARILQEYVPNVTSTSPGQIPWDAPSPIQSDDDDEFEDLSTEKIP
ncbi:hypothetical protein C8R48DRAFT_679252 [Suillus tomentosus]|nr:hypothetical protein C8R48DRAFT_679252 [Suillus tomentosus]